MRPYIFGVFLFIALSILPACFTSAPAATFQAPTRAPTPTPEMATITWGFWGEPWEVAINERVISVFEADFPSIHVETFHRPWSAYRTEMRARFEAGEPVPDVLFWSEPANDVSSGYLMELTPYIEKENYDLDRFFPGLLVPFRVNGRMYGLPRDSDTKVVFYNKRLFNRASLSYPRQDWTWEDLRQTSVALKEANVADYSFAYEANDWWMIWVWQNGAQLVDDKVAPTETYLGDPAVAEAIQFLADLTNVDQVTPPYEALNSTDIATLFMEDKLAMAFGNHALIPAFAQVEGLEWDIVGLPQQVRQANLAAGAGYVIAADTPQPDAAWTFLKFLSGPKGQAIFTESGVIVPARRSVAQSEVFLQQMPPHNARVFLRETELGESNLAFPGSHEFMELTNAALAPVWRGQQDAPSAIEAILPQARAIIAQSQAASQQSQ